MIALLLALVLQPSAQADPPCKPYFWKPHEVPAERQQEANLSRFTNEATEHIKAADQAADDIYRKLCDSKAGPAGSQLTSQGSMAGYNNTGSAHLTSGITALQQHMQKLKEDARNLVQKDVLGNNVQGGTDGRGSLSEKMKDTDPTFKDRFLDGKDASQYSAAKSAFRKALSSMSTITEDMGTDLLNEQKRAFNEIIAAQRELQQEISKLRTQQQELSRNARTNTDNAGKLGQDNKSNQSAVTGGSPSGGSPAGGSPSGGSPSGGQSGGQPSGLTQQPTGGETGATSPTPNGTNPGGSTAGGSGGSDGSNGASGGRGGGPDTVGGVTNIGDLANPKTIDPVTGAPRAPTVRSSGSSGSAGFDGAGGGSTRRATGAATATPVGGGGVSAGGLGGSEAKGDGKSDGSGSSKPGYGVGGDSAAGGAGASGGGSSGGGGDEVLSPFGKPLSDPKFSLAGSETDASVKNMLGALDGSAEGGEGARDPASDVSEGIGERNSADLFDRVHAYHERCQQRGCVVNAPKRKVGGA